MPIKIICSILVPLFFLVKFGGGAFVEALYQNGAFGFLNYFSRTAAAQPLEFYLGQMEDFVIGPVSSLISGIVLIIVGLPFLKDKSIKVFTGAVFLFLLITKFEVLFFPPYGDTVGGPFAEALWLKNHHFNYWALNQQPIYIAGGAKVYLFSIYPTFLALGMTLIPNAIAFLVINHLIVFALTAGTVAIFREILLKLFDKETSLLMAFLLLSLPLVQSQSEAINMEMPMVFFSLLAIYYLIEKRLILACTMAVVATLVKGVAILIGAVVVFVCLVMFILDEEFKFKKRVLGLAFLTAVLLGLKFYASIVITNEGQDVDMVGPLSGWASIKHFQVFYVYMVSFFIFLILCGRRLLQVSGGVGERLRLLWQKERISLIMFMAATAWILLFLNSYAVSPRYRLLWTPFTVFCIFYVITCFVPQGIWRQRGLAVAVLFSFFCAYGFLYGPMANNNHVVLERSLEYRNDLKLTQKIVKYIEDNFAGFTVGAPFIYAQIMALPELGYTRQNFDVVIYGMRCAYGGIKNFSGLKTMDVRRTVWIGFNEGRPMGLEYPIDPNDRVIKEIRQGAKTAKLFLGGRAIEKMRLMVEYLHQRQMIRKTHP